MLGTRFPVFAESGGAEPFFFALIQENLPPEEQRAPETKPVNDCLVYLIIALVGIAAVIFVHCTGALRLLF